VAARVVIVDDHESFRRLARRMLLDAGFSVVGEACDGASALRKVLSLRPDVVLLDIVLPDCSGLAVAEELVRADQPPRVVLTSSRSWADFGGDFRWPVGCDFLPKHRLSGAALICLVGPP
jgi:DNA-binding NarL/FixJ family response regulator